MDLIYTNQSKVDIGVLFNYSLDLAFGEDENNFTLTTSTTNNALCANSLIYIDSTEYGGIVDSVKVITKTNTLKYSGRTFQGVLNSKVLMPNAGEDYLHLVGSAKTVLNFLLQQMELLSLFDVGESCADFAVNYKMPRYIKGYNGIQKLLLNYGYTLVLEFGKHQKIELTAVPIVDYSQNDEFDNSQIDFTIEKVSNNVNHIIGLGSGELSQRQICHYYTDQNGEITTKQHYFGVEEIAATYDYPSVESLEELQSGAFEKLKELQDTSSMQIALTENNTYHIGDIVGGKENITQIYIAKEIVKKIVKIDDNIIKIEHKVGE